MNILYSQCWEDPRLLAEALAVRETDDVLSVASGGDNSLALLLSHPRTLTAIDFNPAQLYLMELKMAGMQLSYEDFVGFVGARCRSDRLALYSSVRGDLSSGARRFWDRHTRDIRLGVIHCGRLERYLASFRRWVLPLIHGRGLVTDLLNAASLAEQSEIYYERWDRRRWRSFFRFFFSQSVMSRLGRHPAWFRHVAVRDVGATLLERTRLGLTRVPTQGNYFLEYILTGGYRDLAVAPPYLRRANFKTLQENLGRVQLVCCDLRTCLERTSVGAYSCFNLSDVFEYMSAGEAEVTWRKLLQIARPESRLASRMLFVPRPPPPDLDVHRRTPACSLSLSERDRTFFYDRIVALEAG